VWLLISVGLIVVATKLLTAIGVAVAIAFAGVVLVIVGIALFASPASSGKAPDVDALRSFR
jgi:hypothetical protein